MGVEHGRKVGAAVLVAGQRRIQVQLGLRQQATSHQRFQPSRDLHSGQAFTEFRQALVQVALTAQARRFQGQVGLALLRATAVALQRNVDLEHQLPFADTVASLDRRHAQAHVRIAIALHQVASLLGAGDARVVGHQLRIVGAQPLFQRDEVQPGRRWQRTQVFRRMQRQVLRSSQQGADARGALRILAFQHHQVRLHRDDLGLRAQGVLLAAETVGIAHAGDFRDAPHQVEVLLRIADARHARDAGRSSA